MIIGVISDTHDRLETIDKAMSFFGESDVQLIVHCGDWKLPSTAEYFAAQIAATAVKFVGVLGNNDIATDSFLLLARNAGDTFNLYEGAHEMGVNDRRLLIYHGHHKPTLRFVRESGADIILLGHSHKPTVELLGKSLVVNPGSTAFAIPRSKSWQPSVALVDTDLLTATITYL